MSETKQVVNRVVFSLVHNDGPNDSRVMKEAKALVESGYQVYLFCKKFKGAKERDVVEGVNILRFDCWGTGVANQADWLSDLSFLDRTQEKISASTTAFSALEKRKLQQMKVKESGTWQSLWVQLKIIVVKILRALNLESLFFYFYRRRENFSWRLVNKLLSYLPHQPSWLRTALVKPVANNNFNHMYYAKYGIYYGNLKKVDHGLRPFLIHCHDLYTLPAGIALASQMGAKVIYDAHELETERVPPLPPERKSFIQNLEADCMPHTSGIISVSPFLVEYYKERFDGPVNLVMNIPEVVSGKQVTTVRNRLGLSLETPLIIYTGGVGGPYRGLHLVVKGLAQLPEFQLAILGPRNPGYDEWIMGYIKKYGLNSRVHLMDPVAPDEVVSVIQDADIAVCPIQDATLSYRHCLPNKLFESIQAGVPVCASNLPEMAKVLGDLDAGIVVNEKSHESIAQGLKKLYDEKNNYKLKDNKKDYYQKTYSWEAQKESLIELYRQLR